MQRSMSRYALGGVIVFIVSILSAATSVVISVQNIEREAAHLSDGIITWVEVNGAYDVAMVTALGSLQTYLVDYEAEELDEAEIALDGVDDSLAQLALLEQADALTAHGDLTQLADIQQRRRQIRADTATALAALRTSGRSEASKAMSFAAIEAIEEELVLLHNDQLQVRAQSTATANTEIASAFQQTLVVVAGISAAMITLALVLYSLVRRRIAHPLARLTDATSTIGAGQYPAILEHDGIAEVGQLQRGFQRMAQLLSQREAALAQQFAELEESHAQTRQAEQALTRQLEQIAEQREIIREMSVPLLPIGETLLVMPLIGTLDSERLDTMQGYALDRISRQRTDMLLIDVTGVPIIDSHVAQGLISMVRAARLLGTRVAMVGIRPEVAQTIVGLGLDLDEIRTFANLQEGIRSAVQQSRGAAPRN